MGRICLSNSCLSLVEKERLGKCCYKRVQVISEPQKKTGIGTSALAIISA